MPRYFNHFPVLKNTQQTANNTVNVSALVVNLLTRVTQLDTFKNDSVIYYNYDVQDGDTPESVAERFYGDSEKHWVILYTNNIIDPYYDWPLSYLQFTNYLEKKYLPLAANSGFQTGTAYALSTVYQYQQLIVTTDSLTGNTTTVIHPVDLATFNHIVPFSLIKNFSDGSSVTYSLNSQVQTLFDYENKLNESKRNIKLLNPDFMNQIYGELQNLLKTGN